MFSSGTPDSVMFGAQQQQAQQQNVAGVSGLEHLGVYQISHNGVNSAQPMHLPTLDQQLYQPQPQQQQQQLQAGVANKQVQKRKKKKDKPVTQACIICSHDHASCDDARPCKRCVTKGFPHLCKNPTKDKPVKKGRPARGLQMYTNIVQQHSVDSNDAMTVSNPVEYSTDNNMSYETLSNNTPVQSYMFPDMSTPSPPSFNYASPPPSSSYIPPSPTSFDQFMPSCTNSGACLSSSLSGLQTILFSANPPQSPQVTMLETDGDHDIQTPPSSSNNPIVYSSSSPSPSPTPSSVPTPTPPSMRSSNDSSSSSANVTPCNGSLNSSTNSQVDEPMSEMPACKSLCTTMNEDDEEYSDCFISGNGLQIMTNLTMRAGGELAEKDLRDISNKLKALKQLLVKNFGTLQTSFQARFLAVQQVFQDFTLPVIISCGLSIFGCNPQASEFLRMKKQEVIAKRYLFNMLGKESVVGFVKRYTDAALGVREFERMRVRVEGFGGQWFDCMLSLSLYKDPSLGLTMFEAWTFVHVEDCM